MTNRQLTYLIIFVLSALVPFQVNAKVRLPAIFSSNMVLQQNKEVAIWGWASPAEIVKITGSWNNQTVEVKTGRGAKWKILLPTPAAGGPFTVTIKGQNTIVLENVLIGEVWLGSGQSNMESSATHSYSFNNKEEEVKNSDYPNIRLFHIEKATSDTRQEDLTGSWTVCSPETMKTFSGTAYFFGRELHKKLDIPIGLIHSSWGGTAAEVWMDKEVIEAEPQLSENAAKVPAYDWWPRKSGSAFNAMIAPIIPYDIAGVIWYQGESNTLTAIGYRKLFPALIQNWRDEWKSDFPFYYVQIAPCYYNEPNVGVLLREAQLKTLGVSNTGMVVISDIGDIGNIHPTNKQDVGYRLAQWALAKTYGMGDIAYSGPIYKEMKIEGKKVRLYFDHSDNGLVVKGEELTHFEIAGGDRKFFAAKAKITKSTVEVWNNKVKEPVAVRFAWDNIAEPNLFNTEGLPTSSFRTDDCPMKAAAGFISKLDNGKSLKVAALGTSLTGGAFRWFDVMREWLDVEYPGQISFLNEGVGASASSSYPPGGSGLDKVEVVAEFEPDVVFIEFAVNDSYQPYNISVEKSRKNLESMISTLKKHNPDIEIVIQTMNVILDIPELNGTNSIHRPELINYYNMNREVAKAHNLILIDHYLNWSNYLNNEGRDAYLKIVPDGVHPSLEGYRMILLPELQKVLR